MLEDETNVGLRLRETARFFKYIGHVFVTRVVWKKLGFCWTFDVLVELVKHLLVETAIL